MMLVLRRWVLGPTQGTSLMMLELRTKCAKRCAVMSKVGLRPIQETAICADMALETCVGTIII